MSSHSRLAGTISRSSESEGQRFMVSEVQKKIHELLSREVPDVFTHPANIPDETVLDARLIRPLEVLWRAKEVTALLQESTSSSNYCGKVFKNGEPCIFCKDCETDPTCCLCLDCFENSEHKFHNYKMFNSGGGGCCDCGDAEAWTKCVYCKNHQPSRSDEKQVDPLKDLPTPLVNYARTFFSTVLWYSSVILSWEESRSLPPYLMARNTQTRLDEDSFVALLINDEVHSYDQVIIGLSGHLGMSHTEAVGIATHVDRKGRGMICRGSEEQCLLARNKVNTRLQTNPLNVSVLHKVLVSHQCCAIYLLNYLKELAEQSDGHSRLISMCLVEPSLTASNQCILDRFFVNDNSLWIDARLAWHRVVMSSIFKDSEYKKYLALNLARNYPQLAKNFIADSHHHDVCAINLTVQLFTVPSLCRVLLTECNVVKICIDTIRAILETYRLPDGSCYNLNTPAYSQDRITFVLYDLRYVLRNVPDTWDAHLRTQCFAGLHSFLALLASMQHMDAVKRQHGFHLEIEPAWENSVNFTLIFQVAFHLMVQWCITDKTVLLKATKLALQKYHEVVSKPQFKPHDVDSSVMGRRSVELVVFDILKEKVSLHQPLPRFIAALLTGASRHGLDLNQMLGIIGKDIRTPLNLMEYSSRAIVMASQVLGGMWKRNGLSLVNQVACYQFHLCRDVMYDKDIAMLQCMAAIMDPNVFVYALIFKFRLEKWLKSPGSVPTDRREMRDDAVRFLITELEEFLFLMITVFGERHVPGIGEGMTDDDSLRRELIHMLYITAQPHSKLMKKFRASQLAENENKITEMIKKVATSKRVSSRSAHVFELKEECKAEYNPFFYHYNRVEQSQAADVWRKGVKSSGGSHRTVACPPRSPPPFTIPFRGILRLMQSPVLVRVLCNVLQEGTKQDSKFWSERLLHEAVFLCALMLLEEKREESTSFSSIALSGKSLLLRHLEALKSCHRVEEHQPLLLWVIQRLRSIHGKTSESSAPEAMEETDGGTSPTTDRRREAAEAQRRNLMQQIASMQKRFYQDHKAELDQIESPAREKQSGAQTVLGTSGTSCAVGLSALQTCAVSSVSATCILCQEESKDLSTDSESLVLASCVQRSNVLRRGEQKQQQEIDFMGCRLDSKWGIFTGGCGHIMHSACWKKYVENKQAEQRRSIFFFSSGRSVNWGDGEYICPLCQAYGNSCLPFAPPAKCPVTVLAPSCDVTLKMCRGLIHYALQAGLESPMEDDSTSEDVAPSEFSRRLKVIFTDCSLPSRPLASVQMDIDSEASQMSVMQCQAVFMQGYACSPDESSLKVPVAQWNNCAFTITALEHSARSEGRFLLDYVSPRQVDQVRSLAELGKWSAISLETRVLAEHVNALTNIALPTMSAFSEYPSVAEMDVFSCFVNYRFTVSALLDRLTHLQKGQSDQLLHPLLAIVDQYLVNVMTAVQLLQYLVCCPPGMDIEPDSSYQEEGLETSEGTALQKKWCDVRRLVCGASVPAEVPPSPCELYIGMQEHLYPFLQCVALLFRCTTGIQFVHSSATAASNFADLCKFLSLPDSLPSLLDLPVIDQLVENLCGHPRLPEVVRGGTASLPLALQPFRKFITLPSDFSELIKRASQFKCPVKTADGDDSQAAMLCLLCGNMLCTNSLCCQKPLEDDESVKIGGLTQHAQVCGAGFGVALWILESYVVLLDATDLHNVRGCTIPTPYLDQYGEADPGLRRGNRLMLDPEQYTDIQKWWWTHQLPGRICHELEHNMRLIRINWSRM